MFIVYLCGNKIKVMELKTTEKFVREAHEAACSEWKSKIEKEFPDLFRKELQVGKWYIPEVEEGSLWFIDSVNEDGLGGGYGLCIGVWERSESITINRPRFKWREATGEEVESALIEEAKRRFGEDWKNVKVKECLYYEEKEWVNSGDFIPYFYLTDNILWSKNGAIFYKGQWAEILHEEKKVVTLDKAIKILAKKYNVNPEKIEIK